MASKKLGPPLKEFWQIYILCDRSDPDRVYRTCLLFFPKKTFILWKKETIFKSRFKILVSTKTSNTAQHTSSTYENQHEYKQTTISFIHKQPFHTPFLLLISIRKATFHMHSWDVLCLDKTRFATCSSPLHRRLYKFVYVYVRSEIKRCVWNEHVAPCYQRQVPS